MRQNEYLTVWKNITDVDLLIWHVILIPGRLVAALLRRDWPALVGFGRAIRRLPRVPAARRAAKQHFRLNDREVLRLISTASIDGSIGSV